MKVKDKCVNVVILPLLVAVFSVGLWDVGTDVGGRDVVFDRGCAPRKEDMVVRMVDGGAAVVGVVDGMAMYSGARAKGVEKGPAEVRCRERRSTGASTSPPSSVRLSAAATR